MYRIIGICHIFNEIRKGNLHRFLKNILPLVDELVVYDDGSTDGSFEFVSRYTKYVIRGIKNNFEQEIEHRRLVVDCALSLKPDFLLWLDADEVLTANAASELQKICSYCVEKELDGLSLHELNLWRSNTWRRLDSLYDDGWFVRLWRASENIRYKETKPGLHQATLVPPAIKKVEKCHSISVIHYGFASKKTLSYKYLTYKAHGQSGYNMLDRLIDEKLLKLEKMSQSDFPPELWTPNESMPTPLTFEQALLYTNEYKKEVKKPLFSIICLIYKSVEWARFVYQQVLKYTDMETIEFFFVANNAEKEVLEYLKNQYMPYYVFESTEEQKKEWYINNIYRAYNYGVSKASGDFVVFINSDMGFSPNWLENLWAAYNGKNCVSSRLIESGRLRSGQYGIEKDFGDNPGNYREKAFIRYSSIISEGIIKDGGLYMPLLVNKESFLAVGGYPEGNIEQGCDLFCPRIAKKNMPLITGDLVLIEKLKITGVAHTTAFNSIVYHFQMGEMRDNKRYRNIKNESQIALCNDLVTGTMGERVFWDFILENLPSTVGVDAKKAGWGKDISRNLYLYIKKNHPDIKVIIQNASFIGTVDPNKYTIMFLQDNLRKMGMRNKTQETNLGFARKLVTNSIETAASYPEYDFTIIPIGVDDTLFHPIPKVDARKKMGYGDGLIGVFVGSLSEVKGWEKVHECIEHFQEITWIVVTKYKEQFFAKNVRLYQQIPQAELVYLLNCADFFILGSPVETQCLAAIEAALCDVPIIMQNTGVFADFTEKERSQIGIFGDDFIYAVNTIINKKFHPRTLMMSKDITIESSMGKWYKLVVESMTIAAKEQLERQLGWVKKHRMEKKYFVWRYPYLGRIIVKLTRKDTAFYKAAKHCLGNVKKTVTKVPFLRILKHAILDKKKRQN